MAGVITNPEQLFHDFLNSGWFIALEQTDAGKYVTGARKVEIFQVM